MTTGLAIGIAAAAVIVFLALAIGRCIHWGNPSNEEPLFMTVCAWCGKRLGWRPASQAMVSHGICKRCAKRLLADGRA